MAAKKYRPGRTLAMFFLGLAVSYGLVALAGNWKPELGLDLRGGTRIQLTAKGDVTPESLIQAAEIIDSRVNGSGVVEAEVTTSDNRYVIVEIPGKSRADLVDLVSRQAQLRFRVVAQTADGGAPAASGTPEPTPGAGVLLPEASPSASTLSIPPTAEPSPAASPTATPAGRAPYAARALPSDTASPSAKATKNATASDAPSDAPSANPSDVAPPADGSPSIDDPLAWALNPGADWVAKLQAFTCPDPGAATDVVDDPDQPLITCDGNGTKFLLSKAMIEGTQLDGADAGAPNQTSLEWVVQLDFDNVATKTFADISRALVGTERLFAIVLDGQVISSPTMNGLITNGQAEISGSFTQAEAQSLATSLKFGALPVSFEEPRFETVGPTLAGNQLSAGITAGLVGLALVMAYCLLYYRGLGLVVLASLLVAAAATYSMVLLLSKTAGFTLTLPGIAGLIVAVGITADSFIVYFERIRDEMRDGKSMRVAVEAGWKRARNTCVAADTVSLLAAVVLYLTATGVVKGFAFALGLSTLIDLVVFFWFTHPLVSWLGRFPFFNKGHKLSGLDAENLGIDRLPAGGRA